MLKAIIFDLDSVLIDSAPVVDEVRRDVFAAYGVNLDAVPDPYNQGHRGSSVRNILAEVKKHTGISIDEGEYSDKFSAGVQHGLIAAGTTADPGLITFLKDLQAHDITCAIATSSLANSLKVKMDVLQIQEYFTLMVTADNISAHKPAPDIYLHTIEALRLTPVDCIIFEDSAVGIEAGDAAGCKVIGVTKFSANKGDLPKTFHTIDSWDEISAEYLMELQ